jgi:hypothetical protein
LSHLPDLYQERDLSYFMHRGRFRPLTISIETVNLCNNDCVICPYSAQTRPRRTMALPLFQKVLEDYAEIGGGAISLTPLVGEVFLDQLLGERLELAKQNRSVSSVSATTNAVPASRISDADLQPMIEGFTNLNVSVYGLDAEEYRLMTRRNQYDVFRDSLVRLLGFARPRQITLGVRSLRLRALEQVEHWVAEVAAEAGVTPPDVVSSTGTFANWSFFDTSQGLPLQGQWEPPRQNSKQCGIPLLGVQVLVDGRVSFCACANFDGTPDLMVGDLHGMTLAQILDSEEVERLWDWARHGVPDFCKTCTFHTPLEQVAGEEWVYRDPVRYIGG